MEGLICLLATVRTLKILVHQDLYQEKPPKNSNNYILHFIRKKKKKQKQNKNENKNKNKNKKKHPTQVSASPVNIQGKFKRLIVGRAWNWLKPYNYLKNKSN